VGALSTHLAVHGLHDVFERQVVVVVACDQSTDFPT
jgi:hypothetical protein